MLLVYTFKKNFSEKVQKKYTAATYWQGVGEQSGGGSELLTWTFCG